MNTFNRAVLFLRSDSLLYCEPSYGIQLAFTFSDTAIKDEEIINEDALTKELGSFITANNVKPSIITIVLEKDLLFEKKYLKEEIAKLGDQSLDNLQKKFEEIVPFENVTCRKITSGKDIILIAASSSFFFAFKKIFDSLGFVVSSVLPISLPELSQAEKGSLDSARIVLSREDSLKADNLILQPLVKKTEVAQESIKAEISDPATGGKPPSKRLPILIGFFAILIIILGIMVVQMRFLQA